MKIIKDGTMVSSRSFYFLLDFNDREGWKTMMQEFGIKKLSELDIKQYIRLFELATQTELEELKLKIL
jgi:hypothetical protein